ncbi:MAG TPA: bifunctional adenosylcobinamide kinase/adenosylcobinamide-phosphate guanylyltransferase [Candidatus Dormibacteraeota bacterium]|nr:bifunctional adenosylcobinamide kinase/adenosylcobinamide-phosphate guanylyltransferase [Candidatus Dormibacteraeota bacterium]
MPFTLLLGGARSGKSAMAERFAIESGDSVTFIATGEPLDDEMAARIARHRDDRPAAWRTIEAPLDLLTAVRSTSPGDFLVVDCLTLWVSNLLEKGKAAAEIGVAAKDVVEELSRRQGVVVSNEVGLGIVPANELARAFRDVLGAVNTIFAGSAERAVLMVAGRALDLGSAGSVMRQD